MFRPLILTAVLALAAPAFAASTAHFLGDAVKGDTSELTLGNLIADRGSAPAVRAYGATLARDHAAARVEATALAHRLGVPVANEMMPEARQEQRKLEAMKRGPGFDREVRRYMIEDHTKDIAEFTDQSRHGDAATRKLALNTLPTLRRHLAAARNLPR